MASNGLVANPSKTVFMILTRKETKKRKNTKSEWDQNWLPNRNTQNCLGIEIEETQKFRILSIKQQSRVKMSNFFKYLYKTNSMILVNIF